MPVGQAKAQLKDPPLTWREAIEDITYRGQRDGSWYDVRVGGLPGNHSRHRPSDPPCRIFREAEALAVVEVLYRLNQATVSGLNQIGPGNPWSHAAHCHARHQAQVSLEQLLASNVVARRDSFRQSDLLDASDDLLIRFIPGDPDPHLLKAGRDKQQLRWVERDVRKAGTEFIRIQGTTLDSLDDQRRCGLDHIARLAGHSR